MDVTLGSEHVATDAAAGRERRPAASAARLGRAAWSRLREDTRFQAVVQLCFSLPLRFVTPRRRFHDADATAATRELARHAPDLADESRRLVDDGRARPIQQLDVGQQRLAADDGWRMVVFRAYGHDVPATLREVPRLAALLERHPEILSATLSVLAPGTRIPLHPGTLGSVLRVHIGVRVPSGPGCELVVGGQRRSWTEGAILVFDDTYLHRARNDTDEVRAVLLLDVLRPLPARWIGPNARLVRWLGERQRVQDMVAAAGRR